MEPVTLALTSLAVKASMDIAPIIADKVQCSISTGISLLTGLPDVSINCSLKKDK